MRRIILHINKRVNTPFYQADLSKAVENFHHEEYHAVWSDAQEMGLDIDIHERVELLKQAESVTHIESGGIHYFFNNDFDAYWEELAQLIEEDRKSVV